MLAKKKQNAHPKFFADPISGLNRPMTPKLSLWWMMYIQDNPKLECKQWTKSFRGRFRLPYQSFIDLLEMLKEDDNHTYF
jgi:hypothetical protein